MASGGVNVGLCAAFNLLTQTRCARPANIECKATAASNTNFIGWSKGLLKVRKVELHAVAVEPEVVRTYYTCKQCFTS